MRLEYFQMIDRIVDLDLEHGTILAEAIVPEASTIFEGHFPGYPLMPGVLLVEIMAQTSGWLIIANSGFTRMALLAAINEAKLRSMVSPGAKLAVSATFVHDGSGFARTKAQIHNDGKLACNAEMTFRAIAFPSPDVRREMEKVATNIAFPMEPMPHE